jgi:sugar phosphate isomerase/epimerase
MPAPLGIQLYTLREALQVDFAGVIGRLADIGYIGVEPYGGMPVPPEEAARLFREKGLQAHSAHLPLLDDAQKTASLRAAAAYGVQRIVIPWLPAEEFATVDAIKRTCDRINTAAQLYAPEGYELAYHNHDFEFRMVDGRTAYDIMLDHLEERVLLEVDTYWVQVGGQDPAALVARLGARTPLLHIKDGPADSPQSPMTAAGQGNINIPAVIAAGGTHTEWLIVELDRCATDMMQAVEESYRYLTSEGLARGNV